MQLKEINEYIQDYYTEFNGHFRSCQATARFCKSLRSFQHMQDGAFYTIQIAFKGTGRPTTYAFSVTPPNSIIEGKLNDAIAAIGSFVNDASILGPEFRVHNI